MANIFPTDFEEKLTMAAGDYILFSDSEDGNKIKKAQYQHLKGEQGDPGTPGADGAAATITVGTVSTGAAGSSATVTNVGTSTAAVLNFSIPQGVAGTPGTDGDDGEAATITVGTTTTLPAGSSATVTNVGTSSAAVLNFGIPKGESGSGSGDVVGPASSTDGHLAVFDGATGKIIKDGGAIPTGVPTVGTNGQVLTVVSGAAAWANASGGDVQVSTDTGNLLTTGVKLWLGDKADFDNLGSLDSNTIYAPIEGLHWEPNANTLAYYKFDGNLNDSSGKGNNGIVNGSVSYVTAGDGQCVALAGLTNCVKTTISESVFGSAFTIMGWFRFSSVSSVVRMMGGLYNFSADAQYTDQGNIQYESGQGGLQFYNYNAQRTSWSWTPTANTRYHVAVVGGGVANDLKAYVNGSELSVIRSSYDYTSYSGAVVAFGGCGNGNSNIFPGGNYFFEGNIDNAILEDKARTATEILDYFNQTKSNYGIS